MCLTSRQFEAMRLREEEEGDEEDDEEKRSSFGETKGRKKETRKVRANREAARVQAQRMCELRAGY